MFGKKGSFTLILHVVDYGFYTDVVKYEQMQIKQTANKDYKDMRFYANEHF